MRGEITGEGLVSDTETPTQHGTAAAQWAIVTRLFSAFPRNIQHAQRYSARHGWRSDFSMQRFSCAGQGLVDFLSTPFRLSRVLCVLGRFALKGLGELRLLDLAHSRSFSLACCGRTRPLDSRWLRADQRADHFFLGSAGVASQGGTERIRNIPLKFELKGKRN